MDAADQVDNQLLHDSILCDSYGSIWPFRCKSRLNAGLCVSACIGTLLCVCGE